MKRLLLVVVAVGLSGCVGQSTKNGLLSRCNKDVDTSTTGRTVSGECRDTNAGTYQ